MCPSHRQLGGNKRVKRSVVYRVTRTRWYINSTHTPSPYIIAGIISRDDFLQNKGGLRDSVRTYNSEDTHIRHIYVRMYVCGGGFGNISSRDLLSSKKTSLDIYLHPPLDCPPCWENQLRIRPRGVWYLRFFNTYVRYIYVETKNGRYIHFSAENYAFSGCLTRSSNARPKTKQATPSAIYRLHKQTTSSRDHSLSPRNGLPREHRALPPLRSTVVTHKVRALVCFFFFCCIHKEGHFVRQFFPSQAVSSFMPQKSFTGGGVKWTSDRSWSTVRRSCTLPLWEVCARSSNHRSNYSSSSSSVRKHVLLYTVDHAHYTALTRQHDNELISFKNKSGMWIYLRWNNLDHQLWGSMVGARCENIPSEPHSGAFWGSKNRTVLLKGNNNMVAWLRYNKGHKSALAMQPNGYINSYPAGEQPKLTADNNQCFLVYY